MKNTFQPRNNDRGFFVPDELVGNTTLSEAETIDAYSNSSSILLLNRKLTAKQIIQTVDMLNTVSTALIMRLERAAMLHENQCRHVKIPERLLELAGIDKNALLSIDAGDGEIYICADKESEDPFETLPSFLQELFSDCGLDLAALRWLIESEEPVVE